jgi:hypothetical protein
MLHLPHAPERDKLLDKILKYESGEMEHEESIEMFQELLNSGLIFKLQGTYQRTASRLLQMELIKMPHEGSN